MQNITKQNNSTSCFVCGQENPHSLKTKFYALDENTLVAEFTTLDEHQSYPGVLHGGIAAAILDETMGRTILNIDDSLWGVTIDLNLKYRKPLPTDEKIYAKAILESSNKRTFSCRGAIILPDGKPAVTATGKFMKLTLSQITSGGDFRSHWFLVKDKESVNIPDYVLNCPI
ncbi:MAG: PaaI family thioesterase [Denitrovibrio sp.]|nr:MAG: PaaI family thioesterase [Denitrovibrio sp.]